MKREKKLTYTWIIDKRGYSGRYFYQDKGVKVHILDEKFLVELKNKEAILKVSLFLVIKPQ
ncbi:MULTISPECIES: hypothetical protein [unclassified Enterococcus]|uniref:hypothetical protein n=1 Tax=unclassified Enterococcus TaxID=2608891 RepID=UPI001CE10047|nr:MULTISPECIES: hypothetical protein [unclassified Enterococcus]MCA5013355.1 hypothetical protein [Enterococcus sp. S23]MCA5016605.1 hypothetical protein [Enterococcus sp. S22(2020)]